MKTLYSKIVYFLLPVFLIWGGLEYFYRTTETNYSFKHENILERSDELEVLILGNSQSLFGVDPEYFSREAFNSANISQSLYFDELILNKYIDGLTNLKAVVLNISYFSLSQQDNTSEDRWRKYFYDQQMMLDVPIVSDYDIKKYSLALARRFNKSAALMREYFSKGTIITCDKNGYGLQDESNIVEDKESIAPIIANKHEDNSLDFTINIDRLERIISLCVERDVEVIIVEMPVYKTYYELLNPAKKNKIVSTCEKLSKENRNVHYLNLSQQSGFIDSDLRDADHLTNEGAEKCSKLLNSFIEAELAGN